MTSMVQGEVGRAGGPQAVTGRRAAVLGSPIRHSASPALHRAAYAALGLTGWQYDRFECTEQQLPALVDRLGPEWVGLSLTMPLKRVALEVADTVSPAVEAIGAANTLLLDGGRRRAENTDVNGIVDSLREAGVERIAHAVILGAGGTAQAALAALREFGEETPTVLVRDPTRTGELRATAERLGMRPVISGGLFDAPIPEAEVVISTLPTGAADPLALLPLPGHPVVLDVDYANWPTALAAAADAAGSIIVSGLAVLLHQAVAQVELMTGRSAPVSAMRSALEARTPGALARHFG